MTSSPDPTGDICGRLRRNEGCGIDRCGLCEARPVSICNAVDAGELGELARATTVVDLPADREFRAEGDAPDYLFNIISGSVRLSKLLADGRRQVIGFLSVGDFVGFGRADAVACSAETLTPVRLCRFERGRFRALLDRHPALERRLLEVASDEVAAAQEHMLLLGRMSAAERVARFLLARAAAAERRGDSGGAIDLPMSRADIADYLGLTVETVSRIFSQFRRRGLIAYGSAKHVSLPNRAALSALADAH